MAIRHMVFVLLGLSLSGEAAAQQVFKCLEQGGNVAYQSMPCNGTVLKAWDAATPTHTSSAQLTRPETAVRASPRHRVVRGPAPLRRTAARADACAQARAGRDAAYRKAGLKRGFALSSHWDNRVHEACR